MKFDVRLATRVTGTVNRRLRMLALVRNESLERVLDSLLDKALPQADELASQLGDGRRLTAGPETEAAA